MSCKCKGSQCGARVISTDGSVSVLERPPCTFDLSVPGAPAFVTPFRIVPVPNNSTSSTVFVDLVSASPVVVVNAGDILLDFDASVQMTPNGAAGSFNGTNFQFLWDGAPLTDFAFFDFDMQAANVFNTFAPSSVRFRSLIVGATRGPHTLSVQWAVNDARDLVTSFLGSGNLTIQSKPS